MLTKFKDFIANNNLFNEHEEILLAVSGGIDSCVMADLFIKGNINCGIAHCNFKLRDKDSDLDEEFVEQIAAKNNLPFYTTSFDTETYAKNNGISIQMAARELRYHWFEHIRQQDNFAYIAIAHNSNDIVETFLMNLTRGTGIKGLTGIASKNDNIIRPLLFASRNEIIQYSIDNNINFREDSSNSVTKYTRNKIRHNIIPVFNEINPNFNHTILENIQRLKSVEKIYHKDIAQKAKLVVSKMNNNTLIEISELLKLDDYRNYLYEFLQPYNFSNLVLNDIESSLNKTSGKVFYSSTHKLLKDREHLIITKLTDESHVKYYIDEDIDIIAKPINISIRKDFKDDNFVVPKQSDIACLDIDKLDFPLIIRKWERGDYFMPLGMTQLKKISDFFIDSKMSIYEKENTWLLLSGNKIVWIIGKRIDERFKITDNTKNVVIFKVDTV